jgi:hypothetical protein
MSRHAYDDVPLSATPSNPMRDASLSPSLEMLIHGVHGNLAPFELLIVQNTHHVRLRAPVPLVR